MAQNNIVLQARMCCNSCRWKVYKAIIGYPGVEDININMEGQTITLKGNVDAIKLFEKVKKKSGNKITKLLHYPPPKEPKDVTVVMRIRMDCGACRKKATNIAWCDVGDVYSVIPEGCDKLTIKGKDLDPEKVCEKMKKRYGNHVELVPPKKEEEIEHVLHPQYFSDDNPNACEIM